MLFAMLKTKNFLKTAIYECVITISENTTTGEQHTGKERSDFAAPIFNWFPKNHSFCIKKSNLIAYCIFETVLL